MWIPPQPHTSFPGYTPGYIYWVVDNTASRTPIISSVQWFLEHTPWHRIDCSLRCHVMCHVIVWVLFAWTQGPNNKLFILWFTIIYWVDISSWLVCGSSSRIYQPIFSCVAKNNTSIFLTANIPEQIICIKITLYYPIIMGLELLWGYPPYIFI